MNSKQDFEEIYMPLFTAAFFTTALLKECIVGTDNDVCSNFYACD